MGWHIIQHSTNVRAVNYNHDDLTLLVRFKGDVVYKYWDVPRALYAELLKTKSPGAFLREKVFPARKFEKIDGRLKAEDDDKKG